MSAQKIESTETLDQAFERSKDQTVIIFKHSLTCPVSTAALREYEKFLADHSGTDATLIEIQNHRPLSSAVAERTGVRHESPQALVLRDGEVAWHASHWAITAQSLTSAASS